MMTNETKPAAASESVVSTRAQHAPGPWRYNDPEIFDQGYGKFSETAVYAAGNAFPWRMAEIQGPDLRTEIATARLIAAAPDMLAEHVENARILRFLVNELQGRIEGGKLAALHGCLNRCDAAIAKAEGRS